MTAVALSIILIGAGVMGLLAAADVVSVSVPVFLAGALVLTGLALIGGAWIGRTRGLIVVGILLTIALAASAAVHTSFRGGAGDRRWVPATARELRHTYRLGAGHAVLDLTHLTSLDGTHNVNVSVGAGEFQVIVPARSRVVASGHAGLGQVTLLGRDRGGWDVDNHVAVGDAEAGTLRLHLDVGLGHVQVTRSLVEVPR